ncbi:MAG: hypothetical protein ACE5EK_04645, partial [Nitrospinales bacterium]
MTKPAHDAVKNNGKIQISTDPISPNSKKTYASGNLFPELRVPFREITLSTSAADETPGNGGGNGSHDARTEKTDSILIYDTSGPYTDPDVKIDLRKGMKPLRQKWILDRGDVEACEGRT